ncbi:NUDIX hydrolase domain-like protein [Geopyxis carbonaria]|nr:NUDIX hydrolase domain-like protein [Geopyxis carbonaria]
MATDTTTTAEKPHKLYTLILPLCLRTRRVLLGYKKRGFGVGKYNGFGGKVDPGETIIAGAARELHEESGLLVTEAQLQHRGLVLLESIDPAAAAEPVLEIHVYVCTAWSGEWVETEEMRPQWYGIDEMPEADMWEQTTGWMRALLGVYFPSTPSASTSTTSTTTSSITATSTADTADTGMGGGKDNRGFVDYVQFHGGVNRHTGEWDAWHGMGAQELKWFPDGVGAWGEGEIRGWVAAQRAAASS